MDYNAAAVWQKSHVFIYSVGLDNKSEKHKKIRMRDWEAESNRSLYKNCIWFI